MKFAYADPPYLGCGKLYKSHHSESMIWDDPEAHRKLVARLVRDFPIWAMSLSSVTLGTILPMCPEEVRVGAWVKPFAVFRPNVNPAYAWEPVIFYGAKKRDRYVPTVRDWHTANITLKKGLTGAKPESFAMWVFDFLGVDGNDEFHDLFPGTGIMTEVWNSWAYPPPRRLK